MLSNVKIVKTLSLSSRECMNVIHALNLIHAMNVMNSNFIVSF